MRKVNKEVEERRVRFAALSEKSGNCRMAADDLEDVIQILQAWEERQLCVAVQTDVALIQPWWSRSSLVEQNMLSITSKPCRKSSSEGSRLQPLWSKRQEGEEREEWEGDWGDEKAASGRYEGATVGPAVVPARHQDACGGSGGRRKSQHAKKRTACSRRLPLPARASK